VRGGRPGRRFHPKHGLVDVVMPARIGWWLAQLVVQEQELGRACALVRRRWEHPELQDILAKEIDSAIDSLAQYNLELSAVMTHLLRVSPSEPCEFDRFNRFIGPERPSGKYSAARLLKSVEKYHGGIRSRIPHLAYFLMEFSGSLDALLQHSFHGAVLDRSTSENPLPGHQKEDPVDLDDSPKIVARLELELHEKSHIARSSETGEHVDFSKSQILWELLTALATQRPTGILVRDLRYIWVKYGRKGRPKDQTIIATISLLNKSLRELGLAIRHSRGIGYRLLKKKKTT
jgi:hypothetical protein